RTDVYLRATLSTPVHRPVRAEFACVGREKGEGFRMRILSYAQNQEDVLLERVFPCGRSGFYIDVGAGDPVVDSVTKLFYERGWHGISMEPIPTVFALLARDRARDINLPIGLSNHEGMLVFYEILGAPSCSTFSRSQSEEHRLAGYEIVEHSVPVTTLARLCE